MPTPLVSMFEVPDYHEQVRDAAHSLREGKLLVLPTETVYGTAGLLTHSSARDRLKSLRNSDGDKPFTIHLAKGEDAGNYLAEIGDLAKRMMNKLWPGPVAIQFDVPAARRAEV